MRCPTCRFDNPIGMNFCVDCGAQLETTCPHCKFANQPQFKFCGQCGCPLPSEPVAALERSGPKGTPSELEAPMDEATCPDPDSERKCVTVMFSDLTGYTEMAAKLDPEEVKEITGTIFSELTQIIEKYDGFIEKYIGDAILTVFGAKEAFEDSALRAIKAAREIHAHITSISPRYEGRIGRPLSVHTGINTGVVVTGEINFQQGTHGMVGDTINTAARLMGVSDAGQIIVDHDSFVQTEGYFAFTPLAPVKVKGKAEPIKIYRVGAPLRRPQKIHRLHGLRADLIGRSMEMQVLQDAAENLEQGQGCVVAVCGTAGTGKSRLVYEFKMALDLAKFRWFDANAYPYTQNTPYYPLIDLLTKAFGIEESDNPDQIKRKVESSLEGLIGKGSDHIPYVGGLFAIEYPEIKDVSPEYWKDQLYAAVGNVLHALSSSGPTVICLEDIHWADPSTMALVRNLVANLSGPLLVICIYRPLVTLFTDFEIQCLKIHYLDIRLRELSPSECQDMVCSLLKTKEIPKDLSLLIRDRIDGNPFYVEELINSLVDSEALSKISGRWVLAQTFDNAFVSANIQGVIAGRIDRLGADTKRLLQEAAVIGRAFLFEILQRISEINQNIEKNLAMLERLDLISTKSIQPSLEYIFKHALTQEIVYNGLVQSERRLIHNKIGDVIEILFQDRLSEFYETLAYHYARGISKLKAVEYLSRSGEKSLKRYSLEESDQYFADAYNTIIEAGSETNDRGEVLIKLLNQWAVVHYYRGEFRKFVELAEKYGALADSLEDQSSRSMYHGWLGFFYDNIGRPVDGYQYLLKASEIAKRAEEQQALAYCYTWLTWTLADLGSLDEADKYGQLAVSLSDCIPHDHYLYFKSRAGLGHIYVLTGEVPKITAIASDLLDFGEKNAAVRSLVLGHAYKGNAQYIRGDYEAAIAAYHAGMEVCRDTYYHMVLKFYKGLALLQSAQYHDAQVELTEAYEKAISLGGTHHSFYGGVFLGAALLASGEMKKGMDMVRETKALCAANHNRMGVLLADNVLGNIYSLIVAGENALGIKDIIKNFGFIIQNVPGALKQAEIYLLKTIREGQKIGSDFLVSQACYNLGLAYKAKRKNDRALEYLTAAQEAFRRMGADINLQRVEDVIVKLT